MKTDLYGLIHKAQRYHLFQLSNRIGSAGFEDPDEASGVAGELGRLVEHLRAHARNEETYIHPLLARLGAVDAALHAEHLELEARLEALERIAARRQWQALYPAYTAFLADYLAHLEREERTQAEVLWPRCSEEELAGVMDRFRSERPPAALRADLEFMLPALAAAERARIEGRPRAA